MLNVIERSIYVCIGVVRVNAIRRPTHVVRSIIIPDITDDRAASVAVLQYVS